MVLKELKNIFAEHPARFSIEKHLHGNSNFHLHLRGLVGSALPVMVSSLESQTTPQLFILNDKEEAAYFYNDLCSLINESSVLFFPSSYKRSVQYEKTDSSNIILRAETLNRLNSNHQPSYIVTFPEAIVEKVISQDQLTENTLKIKIGEKLSPEFVEEVLVDYEFERADFVVEPGQFSIRGSIIDIFSFSDEHPYRIDFFGEEVESIRVFNVENQLSIKKLDTVDIIPNIQENLLKNSRISFLNFAPGNSVFWCKNVQFISDRIQAIYENTIEKVPTLELGEDTVATKDYLIKGLDFIDHLNQYSCIEFGQKFFFPTGNEIQFNQAPQPAFNKNFDLLGEHLLNNNARAESNYILSDNAKQIERIQNIFDDKGIEVEFQPVDQTLHEGFSDRDLRISVFTDHQIFDRYHKFRLKTATVHKAKESVTLKEINRLHPGDYIVHADHGIGRFGGLQKVDVNGKDQEAIRLVYKDNDILFVSLHSLHKISKYKGKDGSAPKIYKLGTGAWQKLKEKTKSKVKDIAKELIALYAKRKAERGFQFSPDSYMQQELEASFIYEDTPDQVKATKATKEGMESPFPMDRLVCGDVGFGKTEIAIRAAFKAVADNKQVAVLVPTTILAFQHYKTFSERLKNFPCRVDYISRMRKAKDQREILKDLKAGQIDILIGTHRIIGKDIDFKDLGLLIVDEEQKFGVTVKEKLKQMKVNVDTLTLTATPIPRTLQFSLMGARDLSIINTPPPNRYPIVTEVHNFNEDIIREAISYEVERNGQVFFIHNRVQNIKEVQDMIHRTVPGVSTVVAHGQMDGPKLEKIMLEFIRGDYDVLIATTIIESGLDIPNANTIIINNGQNFGLSELHQLRGRVGRSNKKAFCYLLTPPMESMTQEARQRLQAIENFSELGSGFNIAMQDLDIRGAGNLLGGEQSGFITDIGYETYQRILSEAMLELKENEFKDVFADEKKEEEKEVIRFINDCQIDTDLEILFPEEYVESISERVRLYRELDNIQTEEEIEKFEDQLKDRFGDLPEPSIELLNVVRLRWLALDLGIEKLILKSNKLVLYFISDQDSPFYQSPQFSKVLQFLQTQTVPCKMKEAKNRLSLSFEKVSNILAATDILKKITQE
ncbi:transcription-repair coupling factor [Marinifilum sp. D737]|uniref:transcription-repair coupling factor n=1 Tax=Marinifilum sp. D737 TaxID=2969628 RepID=UPI0022753129|nr:transcription-repair coupling factor [Marinifilum sp. D737]MCY1635679.1 transcription-repair coupling factor [Marinifilum sp. D737]